MYYSDLTSEMQSHVVILKAVSNSLSILGTSAIILIYLFIKEVRSFSFRLVVNLAMADLLQGVGNLLLIDTVGITPEMGACQVQALMIQWFSLSSICWTTVIAYTLYVSVVHNSADSIQQVQTRLPRFNVYAFILPGVLACLLVGANQMGVSDFYQCWIIERNHSSASKGTLLGLLCFYMPLWLAIFYNSFCFYKVAKELRTNASMGNNTIIKRLKFYPLILVFCWCFGSIYRTALMFGDSSNTLLMLHVFFSSIQGFFNALVYGLQKPVKEQVIRKACQMMRIKKKERQEIQVGSELQSYNGDGAAIIQGPGSQKQESEMSDFQFNPEKPMEGHPVVQSEI